MERAESDKSLASQLSASGQGFKYKTANYSSRFRKGEKLA